MKKSLILLADMCAGLAAAAVASVKSFAQDVGHGINDAIKGYMGAAGLMANLITSTTKNSATPRGMMNYSHLDDAAVPAALVLTPGFQPRYVCAMNVTDRIRYEWFDGMASTDCIMTVAAGTCTLDTGSKLSVVAQAGVQSTITVAAAQIPQNKQFRILAE